MSLLKGSSTFIIFITLMHPLTMIMSMSMPMQQQQQQQQEHKVKDMKTSSSLSSSYEDLISKTCNQTSYSDVCMATFLTSNFTTTHNVTIHDLAVISINATAAHASHTSAVIAAIINGSADFSQQCLSDCLEQYGDAVDELQESMAALESCDYETVNVKVSAAMTNSDTCEDGFQDEGVSSPLTERNELFFKLCSNALAIVKLLG